MLPISHPHLSEGWTAGAQRALRRAAKFAQAHAASEVEPIHVLWSLVFDEGRAGARLAAMGLRPATLTDAGPLLGLSAELAAKHEAASMISDWSAAATAIALQARHRAFEQLAGSEAGTDHLLWSLCQPGSPTVDLLHRYGLVASAWDADVLHVEAADTSPAPVPSELQLRARQPAEVNAADLYRILDAAANRAREGLRVIEDYTRFVLSDGFLSRLIKECRHDLSAVLVTLPEAELLASRDTPGDVGTQLATAAEYQRAHLDDVVTAACKRTEEALRTLEEYGKVLSGIMGGRFEQLRYRVYTLEKAILRTQFNCERLAEQRLYLLVTEELCHHGSGPVIHGALAAGVRMFQIREKRMTDRELVEHCRRVRQWTREGEGLMIINDRPDIAALVDADGVHVGQEEFTVADARRIVGPDKLVGVSTHTLDQARQAVLDGADYLGIGPTFPSGTKEFATFPGLDLVRQSAAEIRLPWFAIGGITANNVEAVLAAGARRVAVSGAICGAEGPIEAAADLLARM
jgi:thiamine-phosphate pyrophosphorylase